MTLHIAEERRIVTARVRSRLPATRWIEKPHQRQFVAKLSCVFTTASLGPLAAIELDDTAGGVTGFRIRQPNPHREEWLWAGGSDLDGAKTASIGKLKIEMSKTVSPSRPGDCRAHAVCIGRGSPSFQRAVLLYATLTK